MQILRWENDPSTLNELLVSQLCRTMICSPKYLHSHTFFRAAMFYMLDTHFLVTLTVSSVFAVCSVQM